MCIKHIISSWSKIDCSFSPCVELLANSGLLPCRVRKGPQGPNLTPFWNSSPQASKTVISETQNIFWMRCKAFQSCHSKPPLIWQEAVVKHVHLCQRQDFNLHFALLLLQFLPSRFKAKITSESAAVCFQSARKTFPVQQNTWRSLEF